MAKRDRDSNIWKDKFYRSLPPLYKCFWDFINDDCDNAGVWVVDFQDAKLKIGKKINPEKAIELFSERIQIFANGDKWYITSFIENVLGFKVDELNPAHKFQKQIIDLLSKHEIQKDRVYPDTLQSVQKGKDIDKGKDKEVLKNKKEPEEFFLEVEKLTDRVKIIEAIMTDEIYVEQLQITHRGKDIKKAFEECYIHHSNAPNPPATVGEWRQKLNTWLINTKNGISKKADTVNARREAFARRHGTGSSN